MSTNEPESEDEWEFLTFLHDFIMHEMLPSSSLAFYLSVASGDNVKQKNNC